MKILNEKTESGRYIGEMEYLHEDIESQFGYLFDACEQNYNSYISEDVLFEDLSDIDKRYLLIGYLDFGIEEGEIYTLSGYHDACYHYVIINNIFALREYVNKLYLPDILSRFTFQYNELAMSGESPEGIAMLAHINRVSEIPGTDIDISYTKLFSVDLKTREVTELENLDPEYLQVSGLDIDPEDLEPLLPDSFKQISDDEVLELLK